MQLEPTEGIWEELELSAAAESGGKCEMILKKAPKSHPFLISLCEIIAKGKESSQKLNNGLP